MDQTAEYFEWAVRNQNCRLTWDERITLIRAIRDLRPELSGLINDFSNYDLVEEAHVQGISHPLVDRYFPPLALAA